MRINQIIRRAFEAGLFVQWGKGYKYKHEDPSSLVPTGQMTLSNALTGVILALGVGVPLGLLAFFAEIIVGYKLQQPNPSKFWLYSHMVCSPERIFFKFKVFE